MAKRMRRPKSGYKGQMPLDFDSVVGSFKDFTARDIDTSDVNEFIHSQNLTPDSAPTSNDITSILSTLSERVITRLGSIDGNINDIAILLDGWYSETRDQDKNISEILTGFAMLFPKWYGEWAKDTKREAKDDDDIEQIEEKENDIESEMLRDLRRTDLSEAETQNERERNSLRTSPNTVGSFLFSDQDRQNLDRGKDSMLSGIIDFVASVALFTGGMALVGGTLVGMIAKLALVSTAAAALAAVFYWVGTKISDWVMDNFYGDKAPDWMKNWMDTPFIQGVGDFLTGTSDETRQADRDAEGAANEAKKRSIIRNGVKYIPRNEVNTVEEAKQFNTFLGLTPTDAPYIDPDQFLITPTSSPDISATRASNANTFSREADIANNAAPVIVNSGNTTVVNNTTGDNAPMTPMPIRLSRNSTSAVRDMESRVHQNQYV